MTRSAWVGLLVVIAVVPACASPPTAALYVVNRGSDDVSAYAIDPATGALAPISGSPVRAGSAPGAVAVAPGGRFVYVTNQFGQDVSAYVVEASGALTPIKGSPFPTFAFPLSVAVSGSGRFAYVFSAAMPEGEGRVSTYTIDATSGVLTMIRGMDATTGAGPVGVALAADGYVYAANLLSHDISGYAGNAATGQLAPMTGSPFPAHRVRIGGPSMVSSLTGAEIPAPTIDVPHRAAAIVVAPSGIVYVVGHTLALPMAVMAVRRGPTGNVARDAGAPPDATAMSSVSAYVVNRAIGTFTPVPGSPWPAGRRPTAMALTPSGRIAYVANLESDDVSAFIVDAASGALAEVPGSPFRAGSRPSALAVESSGRFLYVANGGSNDVSAFAIDEATGALRVIADAPFKAGTEPITLVTIGRSMTAR